jgi:quercetin 2,3-dioxygenase
MTPDGRAVSRVTDTEARPGQRPDHRVRVVVKPRDWERTDPFLALMEDWFAPGTFGPHPHRGFETVTYVLEGELRHRDNHGGEGVLKAGDAQLMTAGRGIIHEEEPVSSAVHSLQLWLNLPSSLKMTEPRYQDLRSGSMPVRTEDGAEVRVFSGHSGDAASSTLNHVPLTMLDLKLRKGATIHQDSSPRETAFVYVIDGTLVLGSKDTRVGAGQVAWFDAADGGESPGISITADADTHAVYFAARPLREHVVASGPFVMNTDEEIRQAFADYRAGKF